ncbi:site-specific integrase [Chryseobacterium populi]|uniref:Site-specific recombinase XerD n=1 Tax=Chryseobacterium populi TaxID=1144316 RepID=J3CM02_9FLAO|nr:site-specific integrase [Chryseobacterium populi]EJL74334.1 site-specific recombinase XerD [Chryseobacterium populi]
MLEQSYGLTFFLKSPQKKSIRNRYVYMRVTVDGIPRETSTKRKWDVHRWDQNFERATGTKEDARALNYFLDSLVNRINIYKTELINLDRTITASNIIGFIKGETLSKNKVIEEFQKHNEEMYALIPDEYAIGTYKRFVIALSHVREFIHYKFNKDDLEFRELNYEFVKDYEFFLKTVKKCANNTALKYITQFKKIVLGAVAKEIIPKDPFALFKGKKTKQKKQPLSRGELDRLENKQFSTDRLSVVRDIFVFQCYTGLAYIDVYQLKKEDIKDGLDGKPWIMSSRQKTQKSGSNIDVPLLPKALEIIDKYKDSPICASRGSVLPVKSNQKMNEYLKEIGVLCGITSSLNTHKARRTFASTVTLSNGVSINVVKEMLGHHSIKQTEEYAITELETVSKEMKELRQKLTGDTKTENPESIERQLQNLENDLNELKSKKLYVGPDGVLSKIAKLQESINELKEQMGG